MAGRRFCSYENEAFAAADFVTTARGVTVHVLSETSGHTVDGWAAELTAQRGVDGTWTVEKIQVARPVVPRPPSFGL